MMRQAQLGRPLKISALVLTSVFFPAPLRAVGIYDLSDDFSSKHIGNLEEVCKPTVSFTRTQP